MSHYFNDNDLRALGIFESEPRTYWAQCQRCADHFDCDTEADEPICDDCQIILEDEACHEQSES